MTALETHPGMVVADAYEIGERYGKTLESRDKLQQQGWKLELKLPEVIIHETKQTYQAISTKQGKRLNKANAIAYFYRPLEMKHDFSVPMIKLSDGSYQVEVELPLKGRWDLLIEVSKGSFMQQGSARMFAQ
ncbi:Type cbb3 cytochrome oxidase biogenesis protein CcoH [uncultured Candidatus Thioglobus sp.]|nr:Type cbb3 cytochrome oxidase biogenesis protein CcoH [uncultured Candidatus Thioglobus sp.]